jgi:hypothetical protein
MAGEGGRSRPPHWSSRSPECEPPSRLIPRTLPFPLLLPLPLPPPLLPLPLLLLLPSSVSRAWNGAWNGFSPREGRRSAKMEGGSVSIESIS